jgi:hypothetical protein
MPTLSARWVATCDCVIILLLAAPKVASRASVNYRACIFKYEVPEIRAFSPKITQILA